MSTTLVPGRSERPTETDRDNSVGHSPGGIHTKGHHGTLIIVPPHRGLPASPHRSARWREEKERRRRNGQCAEYKRESTNGGRPGMTSHRKYINRTCTGENSLLERSVTNRLGAGRPRSRKSVQLAAKCHERRPQQVQRTTLDPGRAVVEIHTTSEGSSAACHAHTGHHGATPVHM